MKNFFYHIFPNKYFYFGIFLIAVAVAMQSHPIWDYKIQNIFYNTADKSWWINETVRIKSFFYTVPKMLVFLVSIVLMYLCWQSREPFRLRKLSAFVFCMVSIPLAVSMIKAYTNIHCPSDLADFDGRVPFRGLFDFDSYSSILVLYGNGNCFPAGHASGGYALMSSFFVLSNKYKKLGIIVGFLLGTYMAIYQTLKGAHFLSHSIFTLGFAIATIQVVLKLAKIPGSTEP